MFWPEQLTHQFAALFGYDISPPKRTAKVQSGEQETLEDDSDDSDDHIWMFNSNDGPVKKERPRSPKNSSKFVGGSSSNLLSEDNSEDVPFLKMQRSGTLVREPSELKPGEHESSLYQP